MKPITYQKPSNDRYNLNNVKNTKLRITSNNLNLQIQITCIKYSDNTRIKIYWKEKLEKKKKTRLRSRLQQIHNL